MELIQSVLASIPGIPVIKGILLTIIPLGFLIFIHELGHFLAAKRAGIKVRTFSLGFGPKVFGFQRDETEYRLSWLPFGGYVQMEGENPTEQTGAPGEFGSASLGNRAFVVIAGPAINLLFGILIYWFVFGVGLDKTSADFLERLIGHSMGEKEARVQIGELADDGPGAAGGLMPGDTILSVNGGTIKSWSAFQNRIFTSAKKQLELVVEREGVDQTLFVTPEAIPEEELRSKSGRGDIGRLRVTKRQETEVVAVAPESVAALAGIQVGDRVETINGETLHNVPDFGSWIWYPSARWSETKQRALYHSIDRSPEGFEIGIRRGEETLMIQLPTQWRVIARVQDESTAQNAGIQDGDILVSLNGQPVVNSETLYTQLNALTDEPIALGVIQRGVEKTVMLSEAEISEIDHESTFYGLAWQTTLSGIRFGPPEVPLPEYNVFTAFGKGVETTWLTLTAIGRTLKQLVSGEVSPKYLTGPLGIAYSTKKIFDEIGLISFLFFIGFISINLAIVNLLPIPIADGGHLLFFAIEKIRGKPVPRRAQEIVQQVSVILIIALFVYITWFDSLTLFHQLRN